MAKFDSSASSSSASSDTVTQPPAPLPPLVASPIPQVARKLESEVSLDAGAAPKEEDHTDGIFTGQDGEKYALCIHDPDVYGNTHSLKNSAHFWQGKIEAFNAKFTKA